VNRINARSIRTVVAFLAFLCLGVFVYRTLKLGRAASCQSNLTHIVAALHSYHRKHGQLPPPYIAGENGKPMHSWRVLILPFLGEGDLYARYRFDEPWDGPNNQQLLDQMPPVYRCPEDWQKDVFCTSYVAVVGDGTAWAGDSDKYKSFFDLPLLLAEIANSDICWLEPRDFTLRDVKRISARHPKGPYVLSSSLAIQLDPFPNEETLQAMFTDKKAVDEYRRGQELGGSNK
jgi:hypothetical protein